MDVTSVKFIYFSPTGTTQKIVASVADGFGSDNVEHLDLTLHENIQHSFRHSSDELVIIGAPVYGGRLPAEAIKRFRQMKADKTPAVLIVFTIFKSKMKSRRQGGSDANVRGLYVEELTTMPTQIAL